jgi:hypothetical protein
VTERNPDQGRVNILPERESGRVGSCSSHESTKSRSASSAPLRRKACSLERGRGFALAMCSLLTVN